MTLQKYQPLFLSVASDKVYFDKVCPSRSVSFVDVLADLLWSSWVNLCESLNEDSKGLKYHNTRNVTYFSILKRQWKVRDDPKGM